MIKHRYGTFQSDQFAEYSNKTLHSMIHFLLIYAEQNKDLLNNYFQIVQYKLNGLNELLEYPSVMVEMMALVESAKLEFHSPDYSHTRYRKLVLDLHDLADRLPIEVDHE